MNVLAIDQGTSGTKALVVDEAGLVLAVAQQPLRPVYLPGGGVEQDPGSLLDSVLHAGRRALQEAGVTVGGVALANQGETVLAWDRASGRPLSPAVVWQDRRAEELCAALAEHGPLVARRTGLVLDPYFSAPKMAWLRRNVTTEGVVTTTDTWLVHQLCGAFVTDVATASRSLLLDLDSRTWSPDLAEIFGLGAERLPEIVACDETVGVTDRFGPSLPLGGLIVDQQAALAAHGCLEAGGAKCTFGTGAFLLANTGDRAVRSSTGLTSSVAWSARRVTCYCVDGQVYAAGSAIRWMADLGLLDDVQGIDAAAAPDAGGVTCVPCLAGLAAPWWRPDATATFAGLTLASGAGHLVTALLEGIAAQVAELVSPVEQDLGRPLGRLRVDGGLTQSRRLMQATADIVGRPIDVYPSGHATALGAAAFGRLAGDPGLRLDDAVTGWTPATTYEPQWPAAQAREFRSRWRGTAQAALGDPQQAS